jgi:hypothetical protein
MSDAALRKAGVAPQNVGAHSAETFFEGPIMNEFMTRFPSMREQPIRTFYENLRTSNEMYATVKKEMKLGNASAAMSVMAEHANDQFKLSGISNAIGVSRKLITNTLADPSMSPEDKHKIIDQAAFMAGSMAVMGNKMVEDFKKQSGGK